MKLKKIAKKSLSMLLATALTVSGLALDNSSVLNVKAEENTSTPLSVTAFATPEQLMSSDNFALHSDTGSGVAQKVYFGMNGESQQIWYIAGGEDHNGDGTKDSIVLLCDPSLPMATGTMFEDDWENNKTYSADWRCTYGTSPSEVYPNHYGASYLREVLQGYTSNDNTEKFSAAEKALMQSTKVYTDDDKRKDEGETDYTYYTEDVLYPAYGDYNDNQYITVGANSADSINDGIKVSLTSAPYNSGALFWLRAPNSYDRSHALVASPGYYVDFSHVYSGNSVVPAFRLNLSSVLFASAATAATSDASLTDTMTFRVDGDDKITSQAYYSTDNVIVDAAEEETVYLYVQGKDGTTDWVYSQEVSADTTIATGTIKSGAKDSNGSAVSLTSVDLSQCEIWIEKKVTDDNLVYAVMAKEIETIATVAVTDITAPVAGAELDVAATCNTTGVSTTTPTVSYTKNGESVSGNAAGYLAGYTATVELGAAVGYEFTNETTATINGNEASVSYDADTGKLTVSYTFDKTAKLPLGNAYYVTKDELMSSFDLDGTDDTVGKVYFGTNGSNKQTWYIAGSDADDSIVLLCDPSLPMATGTMFEDDWQNNKTYSADWRCTYETAPNEVYPNHYGASDLRGVLQGYTSNDNTEKFSAAEKELMQSTKVYTDDDKRKDESETDYTYYTEDVLYPAYEDYDNDKFITVGANSADSLNGGLKVSLTSAPYNSGALFWLRAPYYDFRDNALVAIPGYYVNYVIVDNDYSVVPAFRLNLSSVLFASAATAATSDASLTDTMTFRVDGTEKIKSKAAYTTCGVTVNYDEGDGNVFLYVQDADSVYSVEITEDTTLALSDMTGIESLTAENTKIWLEKSEDNVAYALMAEALLTEHIPAEDDGDCTTAVTCSVCGKVTTEAKAAHTPNADDGDCTTAVTCSVCGKVTTEAKAAHTPNADDGDCTTAVTCSVCGTVTTEAKAEHVDANSDGKCDVCSTSIYGVVLRGSNLTLKGNIGLNFYFEIDETSKETIFANETAIVRFTLADGKVVEIPVNQGLEDTTAMAGLTLYRYSCELTAKQMADTVTAQFIMDDVVIAEYDHSVVEYSKIIIKNAAGEYTANEISLVKAMLNYGANAQLNFDYNASNLANSLTDADGNPMISEEEKKVSSVTTATFEPYKATGTTIEGLGTFAAANLVLKSETTLKVYFKPAENVTLDMLTFKVGENEVTATEYGEYFMISITDIKASALDDIYTITVSSKEDSTNTGTFNVSVYAYCYSVLNDSTGAYSEELKNTLRALYLYNVAANTCFD